MRVGDLAKRRGGHERLIAIEHQDVLGGTFKQAARASDRVAGAFELFLEGVVACVAADRFHVLGHVADDDHRPGIHA